jgi:hypothetical protein
MATYPSERGVVERGETLSRSVRLLHNSYSSRKWGG